MSSTYPNPGQGFAGFRGSPFGAFGYPGSSTDSDLDLRALRRQLRHLHRLHHQHRTWTEMNEESGTRGAPRSGPADESAAGASPSDDDPKDRRRGGRRGGRRGSRHEGHGFGPGGPGFGGGFGAGFGPKAERGDIRAGVLALLAEQPRHGYEIIQELAVRSGGVWRPSPGSIYPTLKRLAHEGLVTADRETGRKVFQLTEAGEGYVAEHAEELTAPWDSVASSVDDRSVQLRDLMLGVGAAAVQVDMAGTPAQLEAAATLLAEARRGLYRILAEDPAGPDQGKSSADEEN